MSKRPSTATGAQLRHISADSEARTYHSVPYTSMGLHICPGIVRVSALPLARSSPTLALL